MRRFTTLTLAVVGSLALCWAKGRAAEPAFPGKNWQQATPAEVGMDEARLKQARNYALTGGGSGYITRRGKLVMAWGELRRRYDLKSTTKSFGATALALAVADGKIKLGDKAATHHPAFGIPPGSNAETGWLDGITILHLATQTAGFEKPGGYGKLLFRPGTQWHYSDGGPNWLAECVTLKYGRDLREVMLERVFTPIGITADDLTWRNNAYRSHMLDGVARREFGSGIHANVDAMARLGLLYLRGGEWQRQRIIPRDFIELARQPVPGVVELPVHDPKNYGNASRHYGLLWWNNGDGTLPGVPRDAYWTWGLYDSLILVVPSLDVVVARAGKSWKRTSQRPYDVLRPFFEPIVASVKPEADKTTSKPPAQAPCPPSAVIRKLTWAPASTIIRRAKGSDNWPITWADDDTLYTAYGDGTGFLQPKAPRLSLGLAKVAGGPDDFRGTNIRSPTGEQTGDGSKGIKASGMLMVDGVLWMFCRNAGISQLAQSSDHGRTWDFCDWKFATGFGCPTFLNFGRNYAGARDDYVYVYSHDAATAYLPSDRTVLARVPKDRIDDRRAYEFFQRLDATGQPVWTQDLAERGAVFGHRGRCYRTDVDYNAPLRRYLLCQIIPGDDTRFAGGFGIYDAPEPWGPWTTVFFTERWDVGPGETARLPTKWMSSDGKTLHLVFSGDDCFSVRRATLVLAR